MLTMPLLIRQAKFDDAAEMVALLNPIINHGGFSIMDAVCTLQEQQEFISTFPERGVFHVAVWEQEQRIVGMQDVMPLSINEPAVQHIGVISTFVAIDYWGKRIGHALTEATVCAARLCGFSKLMATIRADNPQAIAFYLRQGFRIIGTAYRHALIHGHYIDEVMAERWIGE